MQTRRCKRGSMDQSSDEANKRPKVQVPLTPTKEQEEQQVNNDNINNDEDSPQFIDTQDVHMADQRSGSTQSLSPHKSASSKHSTMNTNNQNLSASTSQKDNSGSAIQHDTEFNPFEGMSQAEINRQISMFNAYSREKAKDTTQITNVDVTQGDMASKLEDDTERVRVQVEELNTQFSVRKNYTSGPPILQTPLPPHPVPPIYRYASPGSPHHPSRIPHNTTLADSPILSSPRKEHGELERKKESRPNLQNHSSSESPYVKGFHDYLSSRGLPPQVVNQPGATAPVQDVSNDPVFDLLKNGRPMHEAALDVLRKSNMTMAQLMNITQGDPHALAFLQRMEGRTTSDFPTGTTAKRPPAHPSTAPKVIDSTMVYYEADQMYHCRVPLAYTTCNPNTQPLSTTDPFFRNFPSHPDRVTTIPSLSRISYPTAIKDKDGKRTGWANLDKNWHEMYTDRHHRGLEYAEDYGEDTDTDEDEH